MVNRISVVIVLILTVLSSCALIGLQGFWDDELSINKQANKEKYLKINGCYYQKVNDKYQSLYFLYEDGTLLSDGGNFSYQELNKHEATFDDSIWMEGRYKTKYNWGVYKIEGTKIAFERWYPSSGGPLCVYSRIGTILNDTSFIISKVMRVDGTEESATNEIYYFKQYSHKPDSTNVFIE